MSREFRAVLLHHGLTAAAREDKGQRGGTHHRQIGSVEGLSLAGGRSEMALSLLPFIACTIGRRGVSGRVSIGLWWVPSWHPFSGDELTTGKGIQWAGLSLEEKGEIERGGTGK
jgi:hypothetical protein